MIATVSGSTAARGGIRAPGQRLHDAVRHSLARPGGALIGRERCLGVLIKSAPQMEQDALLAQAREIASWDARAIEVPGPEEPDLSSEGNGNIFLGVNGSRWLIQNVGNYVYMPTFRNSTERAKAAAHSRNSSRDCRARSQACHDLSVVGHLKWGLSDIGANGLSQWRVQVLAPLCRRCRRGECATALSAQARSFQTMRPGPRRKPVRPALRKSAQRPPARPREPVVAGAAGTLSAVPRSCQATAHQKRESSSRPSASAAAAHCKAACRAVSP